MGIAVVLLVAGCDTLLDVRLYSSDLKALSQGKGTLDVMATLGTGYSEDNLEDVKAFLGDNFRGAKNFRTEKKDYSDILKMDYKLAVARSTELDAVSQEVFALVVKPIDAKSYELGVWLNSPKFQTLNAQISEKFTSKVDLATMKIKVELNNDMDQAIKTTWRAVFVNGEPAPMDKTFSLEKRERQEIEFSDLLKLALEKNNNEPLYFGKIEY